MEDFVEFGIELMDKVVDKHFHRVPDAVLHKATYHPRQAKKLDPRNLSRQHRNHSRRRGSTSSTPSSSDPEENSTKQRSTSTMRGNLGNMDVNDMYTYTPETSIPGDPYSHEPPRTRPQYQPPLENPYTERTYYSQSPPPTAAYVRGRRIARSEKENARRHEDDYYSDALPSQSRQKTVTRRSHSISNHRLQNSHLSERRLKERRGRRDYSDESESESDDWGRGGGGRSDGGGGGRKGGSGGGQNERGKGEGGIEGKLRKVFTGSNIGLGAGVAGAVIGGLAAQRAQVNAGADKMNSSKRREKENTLLTVLGATAAGLAANAFVDRWEDNKRRIRQNDEEWEAKFGSSASRKGEDKGRWKHDRSSRSSRRDRGDRGRERYRSDHGSSSGRSGSSYRSDSEYLGERHGKGYKPYDDDYV